MTVETGLFPDVERVIAGVLAAQFLPSAEHAGSTTPADLEGMLPFCQVVRYGGGDDGVTDQASVDVDWFAATRSEALDLARQGHQFLLRRQFTADSLIDEVLTSVGPVERPREGNVRRFGGSYTVSARRIRA